MTENAQPNLEERARRAWTEHKYKPIDPSGAYDRTTFIRAQKQLNDLRKYNEAISKDAYNTGAIEDLANLVWTDPGAHLNDSPVQVRGTAKAALTNGFNNMGWYVKNNLDKLMSKFDGNTMKKVALSLPLYGGGSKEHDDLVSLVGDIRNMEQVIEKNDFGAMIKNISDRLSSKDVSDWARDVIKYAEISLSAVKVSRNVLGCLTS